MTDDSHMITVEDMVENDVNVSSCPGVWISCGYNVLPGGGSGWVSVVSGSWHSDVSLHLSIEEPP